jgi:tRNA(Ile)-lysidine synthase
VLLARIAELSTAYNMLPGGGSFGVAVSGGADSVCLLLALHELAAERRWRLEVLHLNHCLRGAEADGDEEFVRELSERLGLELHVERVDVRALGGNLEETAREARRSFFLRKMAERGFERVATGHTRDDQAETVLFRILRGTGLDGLAGIRPRTAEGFVRPLLRVGREEVRDWLRARGEAWREDSSNADISLARNRLRQVDLPRLAAEWNPRLSEALARLAEQAGTAADLRADAVRALLSEVRGGLQGIEAKHVDLIMGLGPGRSVVVPGAVVTRSLDWVRFGQNEASAAPWRVELAGPVSVWRWRETPRLAWDQLPGPLVLRNWLAGDRVQPSGKKVKELLTRAKIPRWARAGWPVICAGGEVVWAAGGGESI